MPWISRDRQFASSLKNACACQESESFHSPRVWIWRLDQVVMVSGEGKKVDERKASRS